MVGRSIDLARSRPAASRAWPRARARARARAGSSRRSRPRRPRNGRHPGSRSSAGAGKTPRARRAGQATSPRSSGRRAGRSGISAAAGPIWPSGTHSSTGASGSRSRCGAATAGAVDHDAGGLSARPRARCRDGPDQRSSGAHRECQGRIPFQFPHLGDTGRLKWWWLKYSFRGPSHKGDGCVMDHGTHQPRQRDRTTGLA